MAIPTEFVGENMQIRINNQIYKAQRVRVRIHGELGDITDSESISKKRKGTVPDVEVTVTKASWDPQNNPFVAPLNFNLFSYIKVEIFPGGVLFPSEYLLPGLVVDDFDHDIDVNMLQPLTFHAVQGDGGAFDAPA